MQFIPNAKVRRQISISGKKVDVYCEINSQLQGSTRIAVECKDYSKSLTREVVAGIIADYAPLFFSQEIDKLFLITRRGIVANATTSLNEKQVKHYTLKELEDLVVDPSILLDNMSRQFEIDDLNQYYIPAKATAVDLKQVFSNFEAVYSPAMDICINRGILKYEVLIAYLKSHKDYEKHLSNLEINKNNFSKILKLRSERNIVDLFSLVDEWVGAAEMQCGLALLGSYGTGKSSFAKYIARHYSEKYKAGEFKRLPLLIELRDFGAHQDMEGLITHHLVNKHKMQNGSYSLFRKMNKEGRYLLIFDGFDEMKQGMTRDALFYNFNEINQLSEGNSKIILAGRPTIFESTEEQASILSNRRDAMMQANGKYIQLEISAPSIDDTFRLMEAYTKVKAGGDKQKVFERIDELKTLVADGESETLVDLISRPVHIPMLVNVLPAFEGSINELNRAKLYKEFVLRIIFREVLRLPSAYIKRYSVDSRYNFARDLAFEMFKKGEARSVKYSEIPEHLLSAYVIQGETLSSTQRDLVAACFLERKPPDNLVFGHKSFLEFLVADKICNSLRDGAYDESFISKEALGYEIGSFIVEMLDLAGIKYLLGDAALKHERTIEIVIDSGFKSIMNDMVSSEDNDELLEGISSEMKKEALPLFDLLFSISFMSKFLSLNPSDKFRSRVSLYLLLYLVSDAFNMAKKEADALYFYETFSDGLIGAITGYILYLREVVQPAALIRYPKVHEIAMSRMDARTWNSAYDDMTSSLFRHML